MPVKYTRELLATTAAAATSLDEMPTALGREPNQESRTYLRRRLTEYTIDTSHFRSAGIVYTHELLQDAVSASYSVAGVVRHLRQRPAGGTQAHIGRRIKEFGIDTSHFTGQAHNRGKRFPGRIPPAQLLVQRPLGAKRLPGSRLRRALSEIGRSELCERCGTGAEWQGCPLTLEVDHINGDWSDNRPTTSDCSARTVMPSPTPTAGATRTSAHGPSRTTATTGPQREMAVFQHRASP
ncbi:HNH endonuclease [Kitasatospora sp. NPDC059327]|uniref:HNH endonuclease n=1 Tax=Kitasatospora sp. NPDC059327 TaxID=3346803 RepID=UPI0036812414